MKSTDNSKQEHSKKVRILPRWLAFPMAFIVWCVVPWAISLLTPHYGWVSDRPGFWNLLGLILVAAGIAGFLWAFGLHFTEAPQGVEWKITQSYLLKHGPYAFSRNPMYLSELVILLGWMLLYGSIAIFVWFLVWLALFNFVNAPMEEHALEERFGKTYLEYKNKTPRWFGKIQR